MSGLLSHNSGNYQQPNYTQLNVQTSAQGLPIPIIYGAQKASGNLLWYGDFAKQAVGAKGGKGGGKGGQYTYSASVILGLAEGVVTPAATQIMITTYGITATGFNSALYTDLVAAMGISTILSTHAAPSVNGTVWVNQGVYTLSSLGVAMFSGAAGQTPWTYMTSAHPDQAMAYPGTAYVAVANMGLGAAPDLPAMWFECFGNLNYTCSAGTPDADPAQLIYDFLTNTTYGCGFPKSKIDLNSLVLAQNSYQKYCGALGIGFSIFMNQRRTAGSYIDEWLQATNTAAVWSDGLLKFIPYGDYTFSGYGFTYAANTTVKAYLTDDDFVMGGNGDYITVSRSDPLDAFNDWKIEIMDRQYDYNANVFESKDQASIEQLQQVLASGVRLAPTITAHFLANASMATMCLELVKNRQLYIRNNYEFSISWENILIDVMDIVSLTSANMGLSGKLVRVQAMEEQNDGSIKVTAEEYLPGVGWSVAYPSQTSSGYIPNQAVAPGSVNVPVIFEPPAVVVGAAGPQVWVAASGASPNWGGATVWASTDGVSYSQIGTLKGAAAQGVLSASLAAYGATNPDNVDTLSVDLSESLGILQPVPTGGATQGLSLCYVGGELLSYQNEALSTANHYNLNQLYRGMYGTSAGAHAIGAQFAFLVDPNIFKYALPTNTSLVGSTIYLKFQSFNMYGLGLQDISTCTAFPYTVTGLGSQIPFTIQASASGTLSANQSVLRYIAAGSFFIPVGLTGTTASEGTAATATVTFTLAKNGTSFGTIAISPAGAVALAAASQTNFVSGDVLTLTAPATPDTTLANVAFSIQGVKTAG
jgi:hypothetical protein